MTTATWRHVGAPAVPGPHVYQPEMLHDLPGPAAAYLAHAIEPGTRLPCGVRLTMHGHIKAGVWLPFTAEETIDRDYRFWWSARIAGGLISGRDELHHQWAASRFHLLGLVPLGRGSGPDVWQSALGRFLAEQAAWLPGNLLPDMGTHWHLGPDGAAVAMVPHHGGYARLALGVEPDGRLHTVSTRRWGRDGGRYGWIPFGMIAEAEHTFGDFTVPSVGRAGWWYGTPRWPAGEFFRFTVDDYATF